jgi:hypothetical protein
MPERRNLTFASLDEIQPDVDRLLAGHLTVGQWTLGQILFHLATAVRLTSLGRPDPTSRPFSEALRRRFFRAGRFPDGMEAPHPALVPPADADAMDQAERLRKAIAQFTSANGPFPDHPALGPLDKGEWDRFHCIHCAHHLSFAIPRS